MSHQAFRQIADSGRDALVDFVQRLVQAPSLSGEEGAAAALVVAEMKALGFDEVDTDKVGNVIGRIRGSSSEAPVVVMNGHIDVVDPGPAEGWACPPWSGEIVDGRIWGRGSVDMKGPVAAMIHAASYFKAAGVVPSGDLIITAAVQEEIGGLGTQFMAETLRADAGIVVEPSRNELRNGHRGRIEIQVRFPGRSAHASVPDLGINPHFAVSAFLQKLPTLQLGSDPVLGPSTIAPTVLSSDQISRNVIPGELVLFLDWRNVPAETRDHAVQSIEALVDTCIASGEIPDSTDHRRVVTVSEAPTPTYTGAVRDFAAIFPPFSTSPDHPIVRAAQATVDQIQGRPCPLDVWQFATDGGHLAQAGIPVVGFGPGDDRLAHTNREALVIDDLIDAAATYPPLVSAVGEAADS